MRALALYVVWDRPGESFTHNGQRSTRWWHAPGAEIVKFPLGFAPPPLREPDNDNHPREGIWLP
jgi:hypothetical protein